MGNKFFKIVGLFSYGAAAVTLVAAIAFFAIAIFNFLDGVDDDIRSPETTVSNYLESRQSKDESRQEQPDAKPSSGHASQGDDAYSKDIEPILKRLIAALNTFGETTGQGNVIPNGLENFLITNTEELNREQYINFLKSLADQAEALNKRADKIAKLKKDDPQYIEWAEFVNWFTNTYMEKFRQELTRIESEKIEQATNRAEAISMVTAAASAFLAFVFFTIILILVRIESNTRRLEELVAAAKTPDKNASL